VLDPAALGTLYTSPVRVQSFEQDAGQTNSSTVRIESNGLYLVQRADAVAEVPVSSWTSPHAAAGGGRSLG
jgi:hypothetical protein